MNPREVQLPSGRQLVVGIASLTEAGKLRRAVAAELLKVNIDLGGLKITPKLLEADLSGVPSEALNTLKNLFACALASEPVEQAIFLCGRRCTIDGEAVVPNAFERPECRGDLLPFAGEVMRANLGPFFASLFSLSSILGGAKTPTPQ